MERSEQQPKCIKVNPIKLSPMQPNPTKPNAKALLVYESFMHSRKLFRKANAKEPFDENEDEPYDEKLMDYLAKLHSPKNLIKDVAFANMVLLRYMMLRSETERSEQQPKCIKVNPIKLSPMQPNPTKPNAKALLVYESFMRSRKMFRKANAKEPFDENEDEPYDEKLFGETAQSKEHRHMILRSETGISAAMKEELLASMVEAHKSSHEK
ncbi:hypothetical protein P8452_45641 [Trifolium repens]|nr:hypothetical protein P8452_45641 [Trifolium repens]